MNWPGFRQRDKSADARPRVIVYTDARPADHHPRLAEVDPARERQRKLRDRVTRLVLAAVFLLGAVLALVGPEGYLELRAKRAAYDEAVAARAELRERVDALRRDLAELQSDPAARERVAREELGLVKPGEVTFLLPPEPPEAGTAEPPAEPKKP
ncbi:MAG TPA: septum formation initiator family protein [Candidatus Polarisedimenticolaceae bacterium]|nr:septum formation initiator family protein [Candidatus Polarisedimenticolaceae bacterium]